YVILGAGLDTLAQRRPELGSRLKIFEIDRPGPQAWKRQRLLELGYGVPDWLRFVSVDFETGDAWRGRLTSNGFNASEPAVVAAAALTERYFAGRTDGLRPPNNGEEVLLAAT